MASGDTLAIFGPESGQPPASNFATLDTRNGILVADFDASTDESLVFTGILPRNYAGGGLTVTGHVMHSSATSGTSRWTAEIERMNTDEDSDSFAAAQSAACTASGTSGIISTFAITFTDGAQMDSLAAGEPFRIRITRDADGTTGTDDAAGDAELVALEIKET